MWQAWAQLDSTRRTPFETLASADRQRWLHACADAGIDTTFAEGARRLGVLPLGESAVPGATAAAEAPCRAPTRTLASTSAVTGAVMGAMTLPSATMGAGMASLTTGTSTGTGAGTGAGTGGGPKRPRPGGTLAPPAAAPKRSRHLAPSSEDRIDRLADYVVACGGSRGLLDGWSAWVERRHGAAAGGHDVYYFSPGERLDCA